MKVSGKFDVHVTVHRYKFLIIKVISQIYFWNEILHVSDSSSVHHQEFFTVRTAIVYVIQFFWQLASKLSANLYVVLCLQWKTPDDEQRNCPKHVEFRAKNKFEKLVHLVGFIIRPLSGKLCSPSVSLPVPMNNRRTLGELQSGLDVLTNGKISYPARRSESSTSSTEFGRCTDYGWHCWIKDCLLLGKSGFNRLIRL